MNRLLVATAVALSVAATAVWAVAGPAGEFWPRWVYFGFGTVAAGVFVFRRAGRVSSGRRRGLALNVAFCGLLLAVDLTVYVLSGGGYFWPVWTALAVAVLLSVHAYLVSRESELLDRVTSLTRSRRAAVDRQAAELKRVERDLHDGAQARMVSLALTLGMASDLLRRDPDTAERLLGEARSTARAALDDMRAVMHSIHPPVLADRGLVDAVRALVLDLSLPTTVEGEVASALTPAVETAAYFAVAECLGNIVKHSGATSASVRFEPPLRATVIDNGHGGADPAAGSGLRGITDRLEAVDGRLDVTSPPGGPTKITITIPV
ncbi:sensor histidine kinase [Actinoplanes bogorensis]|uniref:histidine kinase n=1 Tax=Paractinoplanes bogorensis TaxID=1610840 RepID=A0ABS5YVD8_9ACTN|nr:sensor histidine kinase [Actinoplanes bogorensis]MBU2666045.1 sensor histidine kinase [Actinoplanes bogorensis]